MTEWVDSYQGLGYPSWVYWLWPIEMETENMRQGKLVIPDVVMNRHLAVIKEYYAPHHPGPRGIPKAKVEMITELTIYHTSKNRSESNGTVVSPRDVGSMPLDSCIFWNVAAFRSAVQAFFFRLPSTRSRHFHLSLMRKMGLGGFHEGTVVYDIIQKNSVKTDMVNQDQIRMSLDHHWYMKFNLCIQTLLKKLKQQDVRIIQRNELSMDNWSIQCTEMYTDTLFESMRIIQRNDNFSSLSINKWSI